MLSLEDRHACEEALDEAWRELFPTSAQPPPRSIVELIIEIGSTSCDWLSSDEFSESAFFFENNISNIVTSISGFAIGAFALTAGHRFEITVRFPRKKSRYRDSTVKRANVGLYELPVDSVMRITKDKLSGVVHKAEVRHNTVEMKVVADFKECLTDNDGRTQGTAYFELFGKFGTRKRPVFRLTPPCALYIEGQGSGVKRAYLSSVSIS